MMILLCKWKPREDQVAERLYIKRQFSEEQQKAGPFGSISQNATFILADHRYNKCCHLSTLKSWNNPNVLRKHLRFNPLNKYLYKGTSKMSTYEIDLVCFIRWNIKWILSYEIADTNCATICPWSSSVKCDTTIGLPQATEI